MRTRQLRRGRLLFDVGDEGPVDGETVVLLHGFPQDRTCWDAVIPRLHGAGLRTLTLDQRGYSPGARPPGRGAYRMDFLVADVLALLDAVGLRRCHLVGHDWGGAVAWSAAADHPDRVATLTAVSTPHPRALARSLLRSPQILRTWHVAAAQLPRLPEAVLAPRLAGLLTATGLPETRAARYASRMRQPGALTAALNWYRAVPLAGPVGRVAVPTTYVWGNRDPALGRTAAELTVAEVDATYRFVDLPAGHWLPEREPAELADLVLDQVGAP